MSRRQFLVYALFLGLFALLVSVSGPGVIAQDPLSVLTTNASGNKQGF